MTDAVRFETDLAIGPRAIEAYSRLSYTMWHALAEFVDNSTQSRLNYDSIIDEVLASEGTPLVVEINHDRLAKTLRIRDNSIGMTREDLVMALHIASPTKDSRGRSRYGMGMKTAACWVGECWKVVTCEWGSGIEWTADIDVRAVAQGGKILVVPRVDGVSKDDHYTEIAISGLRRSIQRRTEQNIRDYLGAMYRYDLSEGTLKITYNGADVPPPEEKAFDTDPSGRPMKRDLPETMINGKMVRGWVAVLGHGSGGRKYGGFSIFQNRRQIVGFPSAWKPQAIFRGVDDEGANNLVAQRLTGVIELDNKFDVSHTKDAVLYTGDDEEQIERFLVAQTSDYVQYAQRRRSGRGTPWSPEKLQQMVNSVAREFQTLEFGDVVRNTVLPPLETILANNRQQIESLAEEDTVATVEVLPDLRVKLSLQDRSENDPYVTIAAGAEAGTIYVIINSLHSYYSWLEDTEALNECIRQFVVDAVAEYKVSKQSGRINPDSTRRMKDSLLRVPSMRVENAAAAMRDGEIDAFVPGSGSRGAGGNG